MGVLYDEFEKYMNAPQEPDGKSIFISSNGTWWVGCPWCGKKQFVVKRNLVGFRKDESTKISNLDWVCKNSKCKKNFIIEV